MPLCKYLHQDIVAFGGEHDGVACEQCGIIKQIVIDDGCVARVIPETKRKDYIDSKGSVHPNCFSHDNRCKPKISVLLVNEHFENSLNLFRRITGITDLYGVAELEVKQIKAYCPLLEIIKDDYAYSGNSVLDFPNHCSLMSFSGKNMKELNNEFKYKTILAKAAVLKEC
ncbi:MAG: hypothetical protein ACLRFF_04290 [Alphaproteobacteria bacterium]